MLTAPMVPLALRSGGGNASSARFTDTRRLSVKLALATALHHSAQRVEAPREVEEYATFVGPRAQKISPPGMRPDRLLDVFGPQETGAAAHHGADCRLRAGGPAARCSCAADGGQVGGCAEDRRPLRPRAGDRSAQDLKPFLSSSSSGSSCAADGGTAGGSASCPQFDQCTDDGSSMPMTRRGALLIWGSEPGTVLRGGSWGLNTSSENPPPGITATPGRYINTGQG